jgi:hypothetical protein
MGLKVRLQKAQIEPQNRRTTNRRMSNKEPQNIEVKNIYLFFENFCCWKFLVGPARHREPLRRGGGVFDIRMEPQKVEVS